MDGFSMELFFQLVLLMGAVLAGTCCAALVSVLPGLHVYNLLGLLLAGWTLLPGAGPAPELLLPFMISLVCGWIFLSTLPALLLGAPDESAVFTVLPGQKRLMAGRGFEAVMLTAAGSLTGVVLLLAVAAPLAPQIGPLVQAVTAPHQHWMVWVVILYLLMSEWPRGGTVGPTGWSRFVDAWKPLAMGWVTFALSGLLGFILLYRSPVSHEAAFQNIMPAFTGLFGVPWCLLNLLSRVKAPCQQTADALDGSLDVLLRGTLAGGLGGGFAAFVPGITGGTGGLLAGQACAQRDERVFLVSQGTARTVYYLGGLLLFFAPGLRLTRGGAAWLLQGFFEPGGMRDYLLLLGSLSLSSALAYLLIEPVARGTVRMLGRMDVRIPSAIALLVMTGLVAGLTGPAGLFIMAVATGIGLLPVLFGSRRLNCLGVLLLPLACNMSGFGPRIAIWLGLL